MIVSDRESEHASERRLTHSEPRMKLPALHVTEGTCAVTEDDEMRTYSHCVMDPVVTCLSKAPILACDLCPSHVNWPQGTGGRSFQHMSPWQDTVSTCPRVCDCITGLESSLWTVS